MTGPVILVQTKEIRIIRVLRDPKDRSMENAHRAQLDDIIIEQERTNTLGERYWHPTHHLFETRMGSTQDEKLMLQLFNQLPVPATVEQPTSVTVEQRPVRQTMSKLERRDKLAELLTEVRGTLRGEGVTITPDMPFDNREGAIGLALTPAVLGLLHRLFPGHPYPLHAVQLIAKLLDHAAEELKASR